MDTWKSLVEQLLQENSSRKQRDMNGSRAIPADMEKAIAALKSRKTNAGSMSARWSEFESCFSALHPFVGQDGEPISWAKMARLTGVPSVRDVGECAYPLVGFMPVSNLHDSFEAKMHSLGIDMPEVSNISPSLDDAIVWLAKRSGVQKLYLSDFSGKPLLEIPADELPLWRQREEFGFPGGRPNYPVDMVILSPTLEWLAYTEYESLETEIFGPRNLLEELVRVRKVEGWWSQDPQQVSSPAWFRDSSYPGAADFITW